MNPRHGLLLKALRATIRPAARYCLRNGLRIQDAYEVLKFEMLQAARETLDGTNQPINSSRLSVLTGLQRKDVDRIAEEESPIKVGSDLISRILGQWQLDKNYSSKGKPRILTVEGTSSEFFQLIASTSKNINPYTILFELERLGLVERTTKGLKLIKLSFEVSEDAEEALGLLGRDLSTLSETVDENVFRRGDPVQLHATTTFDNIDPDETATIKQWLLHEGAAFHAKVRKYLSQFDFDHNHKLKKKDTTASVTVGTFALTKEKK